MNELVISKRDLFDGQSITELVSSKDSSLVGPVWSGRLPVTEEIHGFKSRTGRVRGFSRYTTHHLADSTKTFHIELWEQPRLRRAVAVAYHWYDMRVHKVPGFKIASWLHRKLYQRNNDNVYMPLAACQDDRCYYLVHRKRKVLGTVQVEESVYETLSCRNET